MKKITARHWTANGEYAARCTACRDTGYIRSMSPKAMRDAVEFVRGKRRERDVRLSYCDVPCDCSEGDERAAELLRILQRHDKNATVAIRATDERVVKADPLTRVEDQRAALIEWARTYQRNIDDRTALRDAPFEAFERFNQGAEV